MVATNRHATVIRVLRGALAAALVLFLALIGLYLFGRQGKPGTEQVEAAAEVPAKDDYAVRGEGFDFALTKADKVVFEIHGREQRSDRAGKVFLEDVLIAMERSGETYRLQGKKAIYDQGSQQAKLEGEVLIRGPRGLQIETERLDLQDEGSRVRAQEGVRFASGWDLRGRADTLEVDLDGHVLSLSGSIAVTGPRDAHAPWSLRAGELVVREMSASAHAGGGVTLTSGSNRLRAERLNLFFDPETKEIRLARLLSAVEGVIETVPGGSGAGSAPGSTPGANVGESHPLALRGTAIEIRFDPANGQPLEVDLRGLERRPARVVQAQADGSTATLTTVSLLGQFEDGALRHAELRGPLWLTQGGLRSRRGADRQVKAANGEARFDPQDGSLDGVTLTGEVWLEDADARALGDRAYLDLHRGTFEIIGTPAKLEHPRGLLDAPHAVYHRDPGILEADGGVSAVLEAGSAALAPGLAPDAASDEPLRVEAREAIWEAEPSTVRFLGNVRAWQGANTIFAEQLRGEPDRGWMAASGGVRTLWQDTAIDTGPTPAPDGATEVAPDTASAETPGGAASVTRPAGPLEIVSSEMSYSQAEGLLVYTGSVKALQDWTTLTCDRMTVAIEPGGSADEIHCESAVTIVDSRNGRTLRGDRAIYYPEVPEVEVFGEPLTMEDAAGNKVEGGRHFVYDLESGSSRLTAKAAADS